MAPRPRRAGRGSAPPGRAPPGTAPRGPPIRAGAPTRSSTSATSAARHSTRWSRSTVGPTSRPWSVPTPSCPAGVTRVRVADLAPIAEPGVVVETRGGQRGRRAHARARRRDRDGALRPGADDRGAVRRRHDVEELGAVARAVQPLPGRRHRRRGGRHRQRPARARTAPGDRGATPHTGVGAHPRVGAAGRHRRHPGLRPAWPGHRRAVAVPRRQRHPTRVGVEPRERGGDAMAVPDRTRRLRSPGAARAGQPDRARRPGPSPVRARRRGRGGAGRSRAPGDVGGVARPHAGADRHRLLDDRALVDPDRRRGRRRGGSAPGGRRAGHRHRSRSRRRRARVGGRAVAGHGHLERRAGGGLRRRPGPPGARRSHATPPASASW